MSHTIESIQAALARGAKVYDEYDNEVLTLYLDGDRWGHVYKRRGIPQADFVNDFVRDWSIAEPEQSDSTPPDPFAADGFHVECPNAHYVNGVAEELTEFMIEVPEGCESVHQNVSSVTCTSTPAQSWDDFPSYDFTDRATWIAHAWAIKERGEAQSKYPEIGTTMYHPQWHDGQMTVDHFTYNGLLEHRVAIDQGYAFTELQKAADLSRKFDLVVAGAKVVKDAGQLFQAYPNEKVKHDTSDVCFQIFNAL